MNDIIKPFDIDFTKRLHGHVRVETRSPWTGRVIDSQEKDNLVTNAVQMMLQTQSWFSTYMSAMWTPLYQKILGGIMLFDSTLTEQASNISFPGSAKIVGFAGQAADTTNPFAGSYNGGESIKTSNGFTTVWDFATSQANGTIASLARTINKIVNNPLCVFSNSSPTFSYAGGQDSSKAFTNGYTTLGYDDTNKYLYMARRNATTIDGVSYPTTQIYRVKQDLRKIDLQNVMPPAAEMDIIKTLTSSDGTTNAYLLYYDKYDNCFLYPSGTTLHVISAADGTHTTKTMTGTSGGAFAVTENYYWRGTGSTVYRISKTNTADVETYTVGNSSYIAPLDNDAIYAWNNSGSIVYSDGTVKTINPTSPSLYSVDFLQVGQMYCTYNFQNGGQYLHPSSHYLGTIANLDNPVTKSSSQTMKITYTLTEA